MEETKRKSFQGMIDESMSLIEQMKAIRVRTYPINDINFLDSKDKESYLSLHKKFNEICKKFELEIRELPHEEHLQMYNTHLPWRYNDMLKETQGMPTYSSSYDEFELPKFFLTTYNYGKTAVDSLIMAEYASDQETKEKASKILDCCTTNFSGHYWGKGYSKDLEEYESRTRKGITSSESLLDSYSILLEIYDTLRKLADLILAGKKSSEEFTSLLRVTFAKQSETYEAIINWIPRENQEKVPVYSVKNNMLNNPEAFLDSYDLEILKIKEKQTNQRKSLVIEITKLDTDKEIDLSSLLSLSDEELKEVSTQTRVKKRKKSALNRQRKIY